MSSQCPQLSAATTSSLKPTVPQASNWAPAHTCVLLAPVPRPYANLHTPPRPHYSDLDMAPIHMDLRKKLNTAQTDGKPAFMAPHAPCSSSFKTVNATRILQRKAYVCYWCWMMTTRSHESFDKSFPWQELLLIESASIYRKALGWSWDLLLQTFCFLLLPDLVFWVAAF